MSEAKDTLLRLFTLLRLIPREPRSIDTPALLQKLKGQGFSVSLRTVQRDLERLSLPFALTCPSPRQWSLTADAPLDLSDMTPINALALYLAEGHLSTLLPSGVLAQLEPQFRRARNCIDDLGQNGLSHWARRVRAIPNGKALRPAPIDASVWSEVSTAVLERRQLRTRYLSRSKAELKLLLIHPAGLVSRHTTSYLIGTVDGYEDLRQFALHRIKHAECQTALAHERPDIDLDRYIRSGGFNNPSAVEDTELIADVSPQIAWLLNETPLGEQQRLTPLPGSDWQRLRARVPDDQETLWWIFGLGENIRLHGPLNWIQIIKFRLESMATLYRRPNTAQTDTCPGIQ